MCWYSAAVYAWFAQEEEKRRAKLSPEERFAEAERNQKAWNEYIKNREPHQLPHWAKLPPKKSE